MFRRLARKTAEALSLPIEILDADALRAIGAGAVLVGETLMRSPDKKAKLAELRSAL